MTQPLREPAPPEAGDWVIYAAARRNSRHPLGAPYAAGMLKEQGVGGWTVETHEKGGPTTFVIDNRIRRTFLTRGEAAITLRYINKAIAAFEEERDTLLPRYQVRVAGILSI